jgi:hypothetical protein
VGETLPENFFTQAYENASSPFEDIYVITGIPKNLEEILLDQQPDTVILPIVRSINPYIAGSIQINSEQYKLALNTNQRKVNALKGYLVNPSIDLYQRKEIKKTLRTLRDMNTFGNRPQVIGTSPTDSIIRDMQYHIRSELDLSGREYSHKTGYENPEAAKLLGKYLAAYSFKVANESNALGKALILAHPHEAEAIQEIYRPKIRQITAA